MTRRELVEALTVERFSHHVRESDLYDAPPGPSVDWWAAYAHVGLAQAIDAVPEASDPLASHPTGKAMA